MVKMTANVIERLTQAKRALYDLHKVYREMIEKCYFENDQEGYEYWLERGWDVLDDIQQINKDIRKHIKDEVGEIEES